MKTGIYHRIGRFFANRPITYSLLFASGLLGFLAVTTMNIRLSDVLAKFEWQIVAIYILLDLFSGLIMATGIIEVIGLRAARWSCGRKLIVLILFASIMFFLSGLVNNLAAILVLLPVVFVLLNAMDLDQRYVNGFFGLLLAVTNTGGASTPIGDFPALLILGSGMTSFGNYLIRAWPLFLITTAVLIGLSVLKMKYYETTVTSHEEASRRLEIQLLGARYRYLKVKTTPLIYLSVIFLLMFASWSIIPATVAPPVVTAVIGLGLGAVIVAGSGLKPADESFNLDAAIRISSFLFIAAIASTTGILDQGAESIMKWTNDPFMLLVTLMVMTAIMSGVFSAGPAAAAMLPIAMKLAEPGAALDPWRHWMAVAFAAAICAGSSLFLWSATSGFLLAGKISNFFLQTTSGTPLTWGVRNYFWQGLLFFGLLTRICG
jgi:Na+/H+ antiporter NhaD/arsenite permease-like protein